MSDDFEPSGFTGNLNNSTEVAHYITQQVEKWTEWIDADAYARAESDG